MDWLEIGKLAVSAIGGGAVGSLLTQWSGWGVEKQKLKRQARAQMIENSRQLITSLPRDTAWSIEDPACGAIFSSAHFISLEHHLPPDLLRKLRDSRTIIVGGDFPRRQLSEHVSKLEKEWGLI